MIIQKLFIFQIQSPAIWSLANFVVFIVVVVTKRHIVLSLPPLTNSILVPHATDVNTETKQNLIEFIRIDILVLLIVHLAAYCLDCYYLCWEL